MTTLTSKELKALKGIIGSEYHDGQHPVGNPVWSWSCNPFDSLRTFSGAVSSLCKKGLVKADGYSKNSCLTLTQAGFDAAQ